MRYIIVLFIVLFSFGVQAQSANYVSDNPIISIYPNPTSDFFSINIDQDIAKVEVFNIIGRHIKTFKSVESDRFDVTNLASGLYLIRITDASGEIIATKRLDKK